MVRLVKRLADTRRADSLSTQLRRKRFSLFESLTSSLPRPLKILDVGGTQRFWELMDFVDEDVAITLVNLPGTKIDIRHPNFSHVTADARNLDLFDDDEFDVVFSNSVIEHVGTFDDQGRMAREVRRVGRSYFVQTPNRYFPLEPHFYFPFFHFLPLPTRVFLVRHLNLGQRGRIRDKQAALKKVSHVRLLTATELRGLFPGGHLYREKLIGLTKSFVVYGGFDGA